MEDFLMDMVVLEITRIWSSWRLQGYGRPGDLGYGHLGDYKKTLHRNKNRTLATPDSEMVAEEIKLYIHATCVVNM